MFFEELHGLVFRISVVGLPYSGVRTQHEVYPGLVLRRFSLWADAFSAEVWFCVVAGCFFTSSSVVASLLLSRFIPVTDEALISFLPATNEVIFAMLRTASGKILWK